MSWRVVARSWIEAPFGDASAALDGACGRPSGGFTRSGWGFGPNANEPRRSLPAGLAFVYPSSDGYLLAVLRGASLRISISCVSLWPLSVIVTSAFTTVPASLSVTSIATSVPIVPPLPVRAVLLMFDLDVLIAPMNHLHLSS